MKVGVNVLGAAGMFAVLGAAGTAQAQTYQLIG